MFTPIALGFIAAAISGYLVIKWFMQFITNKSLLVFAYYCLIVGILGVWWQYG
jgi:undecaprenyl-diphosphatase